MAMTKRELIQFMDELVELASEENKARAILVKEKFINDFEKSYEYEKEVQTEITELPPYDIVNIGLHFFHKDVRLYAASCSEV